MPSKEPTKAPAQSKQPWMLPLSLTVRDVNTSAVHINLGCVIVDATGASVQYLPLSVDIKTSVAEIEAILSATVRQIAESLYKRELAALLPPVAMQDAPAIQELVGRTYKGSVAR
jgi:hypothetical protein